MPQKSKSTTTIKKGSIRPKTLHKTRGETIKDEISVVTEAYDPATVAFQRRMRQVRKQGNDLITQHEEDDESIADTIRSASSKIDVAKKYKPLFWT
jgi:hypothetical protein